MERRQPSLSSTTYVSLAAIIISCTFAYHVIQWASSPLALTSRKDADDHHEDYDNDKVTPPVGQNNAIPPTTSSVLKDELLNKRNNVPLFPWEPSLTKKSNMQQQKEEEALLSLCSSSPKQKTTASLLYNDDSQREREEIDFLASMTFANGGLRAPSCPCCR